MASGYDSALAILLITFALLIHHKALTPPNPPPTSAERRYIGWVDKTLCRWMSLPTVVQKIVIWIVGVAEVAGILFHSTQGGCIPNCPDDIQLEGTTHMNAWLLLGTTFIILGGTLRWSCYRTLGRLFTFEVSVQRNHKLITSGVYGIVRHPAYSGMFVVYTGIFIWQGGSPYSCTRQMLLGSGDSTSHFGSGFGVWGKMMVISYVVWSVMLLHGTVKRIRAEDTLLFNEFGDEWRRWVEKVPYALVPYVL
ncbi:hypothetical protein BT96DRAFT_917888, partial [Gymnopus androsaceus JB14]